MFILKLLLSEQFESVKNKIKCPQANKHKKNLLNKLYFRNI